MTLVRIAKLAGVSASTVSRVINKHPRVSADAAQAVQRAIRETNFVPRRSERRRPDSARPAATSIAFLVFGATGVHASPGFEQLLRGVSSALREHEFDMVFAFVSDPGQLPPKLLQRRVDGLLLHGELPPAEVQVRLQTFPTVWLMANRERPAWGDQVMPDNTVIGELAARYLMRRGHRRLAFLNLATGPWALDLREMAFARTAEDLGAAAHLLRGPGEQAADLWVARSLPEVAHQLVELLTRLDPRPTGLFIAEDRQVLAVDAALRACSLTAGPGGDVELVSCNNERPLLTSLRTPPATIDIRADSIGRRGVELLLARLRERAPAERLRALIEPVLVEAGE